MSRFGAAVTMALMLALALAVSAVRLEAKGDNSALCASLLSVINNTDFPQAIRDAAKSTFDALGCQ